jgi:phage portal protein BeeE
VEHVFIVDQLLPIHPDRVTIERTPGGGVRYQVTQADGSKSAVNDEDMFHVRRTTVDGVACSVLKMTFEKFG